MNKKRVVIILTLILLGGIAGVYVYWENNSIQSTEYTIESDKLPESFDGYKIVQVADLHNKEFGVNNSVLINKLREIHPNVILITGDILDCNKTNFDVAIRFVEQAVNIAPVYYVTGNHEAWIEGLSMFLEQISRIGVMILENDKMTITRGIDSIDLIGVTDPEFKTRLNTKYTSVDIMNEELSNLELDTSRYQILLSHRPELFDVYAKYGIDIVFCGHAHGGQIRLPFLGGIYAPDQGLFAKYTNGTFLQDHTTLVVSRGLGNSVFPIRVNNRPELVTVTLKAR